MSAENPGFFEEKMGAHTIRFEPPDLFTATYVGDVSVDEMLWTGDVFKRATEKFYIIVLTKEMGTVTAEAKKALKAVPFAAGTAIVGASRQMQFMLSLMNKIYMMLNFGKNTPITFVGTEEEARSWVEHLRANAKKK